MARTTRSDDPVTSVQCTQSAKVIFDRASEVLGRSLPDVVKLAADGLGIAIEGEETATERDARVAAKMGVPAGRSPRKSTRSVRQVSHTPREVFDTPHGSAESGHDDDLLAGSDMADLTEAAS